MSRQTGDMMAIRHFVAYVISGHVGGDSVLPTATPLIAATGGMLVDVAEAAAVLSFSMSSPKAGKAVGCAMRSAPLDSAWREDADEDFNSRKKIFGRKK